MIQDRLTIYTDYINHLYTRGIPYEQIGKYIKYVGDFLKNSESISKKGYNAYRKTHMSELLDSIASHAICDFLAWRGVGFRVPKKKQEDVIPLEKLNVVSANNQALINEFLNWMCSNSDYSESTYKVYRDGLKSFFEYSNEFNIEAAKRYIKSLEATGRKPSTIRLRINALEKFGEWLKKPIRLNRPKSHKKLDIENVPSETEYRRLLEYLLEKGDNYHYLWIRILASTGVRRSEFLQLRWEDIISGDVTLRCKGNKYRRIFFSKALQKEVSAYIKTTGVSGFVAVGKFGKITGRGLGENLKRWGNAVGISSDKMHPHAFRHFFAKMYLKKTKDVIQLADILGHSNIDTTRIYLQKSYDEQRNDFNHNVNW